MQTATPDVSTKMNDALVAVQDILVPFLNQADVTTALADIFGAQADLSALEKVAAILEVEGLTSLVTVEVVPGETLAGAPAAYVESAGTIYVAEEFLANTLPDDIIAVLLQQVGHLVDTVVNDADTAGNEGALFAALVMGKELKAEHVADLQADNNVQELTIEDAVVFAEVSIIPGPMGDDEMKGDGPDGDKEGRQPMQGGKGRDRFRGDANADEMYGGRGRDRLRGEGGDDKMDGGAGRDRMNGGEGNDELIGGGGRDIMNGGLGDDLLNGGAGRDRLKGGEGMDTFVYDSMKDKGDVILDFETAADVIDLSGVLSELGYENSTFDELINDVIVLGQSKKGTRVRIDADGSAGEARPKTLVGLKGVNAEDLTSSNFITQEAVD